MLASEHCGSYLPLLVFERAGSAPQSNQAAGFSLKLRPASLPRIFQEVLSLPFTFDDKKAHIGTWHGMAWMGYDGL